MGKLNFQQSLLQYAVSHNPSEVILICWFDAEEKLLFFILRRNNQTVFSGFFNE